MATGSTEFVDNTTADVFIPEVWANEAIVAREQRLVFAGLVNRGYESDLKFGDTAHVRSVGNLSSRSKATSSNAAITYETITETNTDITVNTWEYSAMAVEDIIKVQADKDMFRLYAGKMGYALDLAIDDVLAGLVDDFSQVLGSLAVDLTYRDFTRARQYLDDALAPDEDRYIVISPAQENGMLNIEHFINRDYTEGNKSGMGGKGEKGWIGTWMSIPVYKSTNVEGSNAAGHDNAMFHRSALALVVQMKPQAHHMYDIDYFVDKVALEHLHGSRELRDDHGVFMRGT